MFTKQELQVIGQLINQTNIKGGDAIAVAQLLSKIDKLLQAPEKVVEQPKE